MEERTGEAFELEERLTVLGGSSRQAITLLASTSTGSTPPMEPSDRSA